MGIYRPKLSKSVDSFVGELRFCLMCVIGERRVGSGSLTSEFLTTHQVICHLDVVPIEVGTEADWGAKAGCPDCAPFSGKVLSLFTDPL